jgi:acetyl esterase/lipase
MPLDARVKRFLDMVAAGNPKDLRPAGIVERRTGLEALLKLSGPPAAMDGVEDRTLPGPAGPLPVRVYSPLHAPGAAPGLIYFHGGGLVAGSILSHDSIARSLAEAGAVRVLSVEYRLAPEHRFPAALNDACAALHHISSHAAEFGIDASRLGVCGDSAGATLAAATCHEASHLGGPPLALQLLLCPILDYSARSPSRHTLAKGYLIDEATLDHDLENYLPEDSDPKDPRVSPLLAPDLTGLPPTLIHTAEFDPLRDEGSAYFDRLNRAGNQVSYTCHPGMIHLFYGLGAVIPYARTAFAQIGAEIRAALA